jgi:hypothetical protein
MYQQRKKNFPFRLKSLVSTKIYSDNKQLSFKVLFPNRKEKKKLYRRVGDQRSGFYAGSSFYQNTYFITRINPLLSISQSFSSKLTLKKVNYFTMSCLLPTKNQKKSIKRQNNIDISSCFTPSIFGSLSNTFGFRYKAPNGCLSIKVQSKTLRENYGLPIHSLPLLRHPKGAFYQKPLAFDRGLYAPYTTTKKSNKELFKGNGGVTSRPPGATYEYSLDSYHRSNQDTCLIHRPAVFEGQWIQSGDLLADCASSVGGELSLGQNLLIAYMPWEGYNYEDAILISERLVYDDLYTSVHIEKYEIETKETKLGKEEITREIPDLSPLEIDQLDENGIIKVGSWVEEGDILVGKTTPINKKRISPYQKLLYTILEKDILAVRDSSLRAPKGIRAKIVRIQLFTQSRGAGWKPTSYGPEGGFHGTQPLISVTQPLVGFGGSRSKPKGGWILPKLNQILPEVGSHPASQEPSEGVGSLPQGGIYKGQILLRSIAQRSVAVSPTFVEGGLASYPKGLEVQPLREKNTKDVKKNIVSLYALYSNKRLLCSDKWHSPKSLNNIFKELDQASFYTAERANKGAYEGLANSLKLKLGKTKIKRPPNRGSTLIPLLLSSPKKAVHKRHLRGALKSKFSRLLSLNETNFSTGLSNHKGLNLFSVGEFNKRDQFQKRDTKRIKKKVIPSFLQIHLYLAEKRKVQVGDKLAGRHGNKGIISMILPREDMPYLPDGTPIDMVLNPLGVPSRMNVGQIYECLLGFAGKFLGENYKVFPFDEIYGPEASRSFVYSKLNEARIKTGFNWIFNPNTPGKIRLYDGRTGDCFDQAITVGQAYILRLVHMVDDKIHCLTPDHDVLTSEGWMKISEINLNHKVATLEMKSGELVYQKPTKLFHYNDYKGPLYSIQNQNISLVVTLNHRMFVLRHPKGALDLKPLALERNHQEIKKSAKTLNSHIQGFNLVKAIELIGKKSEYLKNANWMKDDYQFILPHKVNMDTWLTFFGLLISKRINIFSQGIKGYGMKTPILKKLTSVEIFRPNNVPIKLISKVSLKPKALDLRQPKALDLRQPKVALNGFKYKATNGSLRRVGLLPPKNKNKNIGGGWRVFGHFSTKKKYPLSKIRRCRSIFCQQSLNLDKKYPSNALGFRCKLPKGYLKQFNVQVLTDTNTRLDSKYRVSQICQLESGPYFASYAQLFGAYIRPFTEASNKSLPSWVWELSQKQSRQLLLSMCFGSKSVETKNNKKSSFYPGKPKGYRNPPLVGLDQKLYFYTTKEKLADDVMRLALHAGWSGNKSLYNQYQTNRNAQINPNFKPMDTYLDSNNNYRQSQLWQISVETELKTPAVYSKKDNTTKECKEEIIPYTGSVFCLSVPNEVFYVRRNGLPVWTGNSRSTGPYSLVTQQPLRGRSKQGGQRLGEMEVWALEGYGAAFTLLEMLTIKSDDMTGRMTLWSNLILNGEISIGTPESFKVLVCELQALCLDIGLFRLNQSSIRSKNTTMNTPSSTKTQGARSLAQVGLGGERSSLVPVENLMNLK